MSKAATEAGINKSAVTYWKNHDEARPTGQIAERLCAYFGITMSELYGDAQQEKAPTPQDERSVTFDDFTYAMYEEGKELTDENKQKLLEMAAFFKQQQKKEKP